MAFRLSRAIFNKKFDVVVVGGGPGGYVCAIRAAQLGLNVACVEKRKTLGGTCLNVGCIPSKAMLHVSHNYHMAKHDFKKMGISGGENISIDVKKMVQNKDKAVKTLTRGIGGLFKSYGVTPFTGLGSFADASGKKLSITDESGKEVETIETDNVVLAVGSDIAGLPGFPKELIDEKDIVSSTGALEIDAVPKELTVVGGGVIGLELGSVWARLGAKVHVVEFLNKIMGPADVEVSTTFQKILEKQGLTFDLGSKVVVCEKTPKGVKLVWENMKDGSKTETISDKVLIATGRIPNTANLKFTENLGIDLMKGGPGVGPPGQIKVDGNLQVLDNGGTVKAGIFAIGDCISGPMLAHKAEEDGVFVAELLGERKSKGDDKLVKDQESMDYKAVPSVVYTHPEVAWVGKSEEELEKEGKKFTKSVFPLMANSRARANDETAGFVKMLVCPDTDDILGTHIIAPMAGDVLMPAVQSVQYGHKCKDLAHLCFAHPTVSEALKEAAMKASPKIGDWIHNVKM